ncbi:MAG: type III-B CRISPR module RAMP protein Cmr4 [Crocosphaera sp.]
MTQLNCVYLYLYSPLHTGGTTQEGNLVGIAREAHTNLPYIPSSTIRGRLRASIEDKDLRVQLFGPELKDIASQSKEYLSNTNTSEEVSKSSEADKTSNSNNLEQGDIWIGDGSLLWFPIASLSHGVVWITCPRLLQRWKRYCPSLPDIPQSNYSTNLGTKNPIYLRDAVVKDGLNKWDNWDKFIPKEDFNAEIDQVLLLPNNHCSTLMQMGLSRQVKIKLDEHKSVDGGFRYEEAIPLDTLMYFPWGLTAQVRNIDEIELENDNSDKQKELHKRRIELANKHHINSQKDMEIVKQLFTKHLEKENQKILQIGGQESLGRGFIEQWMWNPKNSSEQRQSQPMEA